MVRLPGVGKKTAERLVVELRDRLDNDSSTPAINDAGINTVSVRNHIEEAISALTALGYKGPEAMRMIKNVQDETSSCEDLIRLALKTSLSN